MCALRLNGIGRNLGARKLPDLEWTESTMGDSLEKLFRWVEAQAMDAYNWYIYRKRSKSRVSKSLRFFSIALFTVGGAVPLVSLASGGVVRSEWGYLALGVGAGFVLLDRTFGYSSSWGRYMMAAARLSRILGNYRVGWTLARIQGADNSELIESIISPFIREISDVVEQETSEWASEFNEGLAKLESSLSSSRQ